MHRAESYVGKSVGLPDEAFWQAVEADARLRIADIKAAKKTHFAMQKLREEYFSALHKLIGPKNLPILPYPGGVWTRASPPCMDEYHRESTRTSWARIRSARGDRISVDLGVISGGAFPEGIWVLVEVGIETWNFIWSNDCHAYSHQETHYLIREIGLSSTGNE